MNQLTSRPAGRKDGKIGFGDSKVRHLSPFVHILNSLWSSRGISYFSYLWIISLSIQVCCVYKSFYNKSRHEGNAGWQLDWRYTDEKTRYRTAQRYMLLCIQKRVYIKELSRKSIACLSPHWIFFFMWAKTIASGNWSITKSLCAKPAEPRAASFPQW